MRRERRQSGSEESFDRLRACTESSEVMSGQGLREIGGRSDERWMSGERLTQA